MPPNDAAVFLLRGPSGVRALLVHEVAALFIRKQKDVLDFSRELWQPASNRLRSGITHSKDFQHAAHGAVAFDLLKDGRCHPILILSAAGEFG